MYLDSVADEGVDENEVREIFNRLDVTGDRNIDYWEFEVLPLCLLVYIVEFLFVHSFSCRKTQNACIFVLSGNKVNGQIRTPLYMSVTLCFCGIRKQQL